MECGKGADQLPPMTFSIGLRARRGRRLCAAGHCVLGSSDPTVLESKRIQVARHSRDGNADAKSAVEIGAAACRRPAEDTDDRRGARGAAAGEDRGGGEPSDQPLSGAPQRTSIALWSVSRARSEPHTFPPRMNIA